MVGKESHNDHEFISIEYVSIGMSPFRESPKQSGQYHTIVGSRDF